MNFFNILLLSATKRYLARKLWFSRTFAGYSHKSVGLIMYLMTRCDILHVISRDMAQLKKKERGRDRREENEDEEKTKRRKGRQKRKRTS